MKMCANCGYSMPDDARFCEQCGMEQEVPQPVQTEYYHEHKSEEPPKSHSALGIVAFVLSLTVSALAGLICGIIDVKQKDKNEKKGFGKAAIIISSVRIVLTILAIALWIVLAGLAVSGEGNWTGYGDGSAYGIAVTYDGNAGEEIAIGSDESIVVSVSEVEFEVSDFSIGGLYYVEVEYIVEMTENLTEISSTYVTLVIKLVDENGVVIDSEIDAVGPIAIGEKMKAEVTLDEVEANHNYTLVIEGYTQ